MRDWGQGLCNLNGHADNRTLTAGTVNTTRNNKQINPAFFSISMSLTLTTQLEFSGPFVTSMWPVDTESRTSGAGLGQAP